MEADNNSFTKKRTHYATLSTLSDDDDEAFDHSSAKKGFSFFF